MNIRNRAAAIAATGVLTLSGFALAAPAQAAPVITGGLVNVTVTDVLNNVSVVALNGVTLQVAAAVCGIPVNVLAADLGPDGSAVCNVTQTATGTTTTTVTQRRGH